MNFKSTFIILNLITTSCFARLFYQQDIFYNSKGIQRITEIIFAQHEKHDSEKVSCFTKGLERFCKEQRIEKGDEIAKILEPDYLTTGCGVQDQSLHLFFLCGFYTGAIFQRIDTISEFDSMIEKTPEMKKFINDMIEKGKSVESTSINSKQLTGVNN